MISNKKIAVIGDKDSVLAFKAIGVDVYPARNHFEAQDTLRKLARDYAVIFITEDLAEKVQNIIERYKARAFPAVIPIPTAQGSTGYGMKAISKDVEKAVGIDILFGS